MQGIVNCSENGPTHQCKNVKKIKVYLKCHYNLNLVRRRLIRTSIRVDFSFKASLSVLLNKAAIGYKGT